MKNYKKVFLLISILLSFVVLLVAAVKLNKLSPEALDNISFDPAWSFESNKSGANLGVSVTSAGDVNNDGYNDILVGAYKYDDGEDDEGKVFLFLGNALGLSSSPDWEYSADQDSAFLGVSVACAGDVNNDNYDDIIIGAFGYDNFEKDEGKAFVFHGSPTGLSINPDWTYETNQINTWMGVSVASAGDVNNDSYSDIIIGAHFYSNPEPIEGAAFVFLGSSIGLSSSPDWFMDSDQAAALFGCSVSSAGDINGDGFDDILVGAYRYDNPFHFDVGQAFLYQGSSTGPSLVPNWTYNSNQFAAFFGNSVSSAGDVNNDGFDDVIVGSFYFDNGQLNEGKVFGFYGSASGLSTSINWSAEGNRNSVLFGNSVASVWDVNGDSYDDVLIGAVGFIADTLVAIDPNTKVINESEVLFNDTLCLDLEYGWAILTLQEHPFIGSRERYNNSENGKVFLYFGSQDGLKSNPGWERSGGQSGQQFGNSVAGARSINSDEYNDFLIGSKLFSNDQIGEGKIDLFLGSSANFSASVNVINGWNMVSFPGIHSVSMYVDTLFPFRDLNSQVYKFGLVYTSVDTLITGEGYWIKHNGNFTYNWNNTVQNGKLFPRLNFIADSIINVKSEWNLIGPFNSKDIPISKISTNPPGLLASLFYYFEGTYLPEYDTLELGKGYWIKANQDGELILNSLSTNIDLPAINTEWGKIRISDVRKREVVLYLSHYKIDNTKYFLPPIPPPDIFDARFSDGTFVTYLGDNEVIEIQLNSVAYPVQFESEDLQIARFKERNGVSDTYKYKSQFSISGIEDGSVYLKVIREDSSQNDERSFNYALKNFPNPFNPSTVIEFQIPHSAFVQLKVYNSLGEEIALLINELRNSGVHRIEFDAEHLPSGLYFYKIETGEYTKTNKMILIK